MVRIHNLETNEIVDREMTDAEFAKHKIELEANLERKSEIEAKASAKLALLERLGITQAEADLLLS